MQFFGDYIIKVSDASVSLPTDPPFFPLTMARFGGFALFVALLVVTLARARLVWEAAPTAVLVVAFAVAFAVALFTAAFLRGVLAFGVALLFGTRLRGWFLGWEICDSSLRVSEEATSLVLLTPSTLPDPSTELASVPSVALTV